MMERRLSFFFAEVHIACKWVSLQTWGRLHTSHLFFFPSYLSLWSVNEAIFVCYLELHWPTEAVLHHFSTPLRDRKSPLPCRLGALPSVLTLAVRTRHFSQGSEDWHPFHFPAWAAQIKGHIFKPLCEYAGCKERWVCGPELSRCINFIERGGTETGLDGVWVGWVSQQTTDLTDCLLLVKWPLNPAT